MPAALVQNLHFKLHNSCCVTLSRPSLGHKLQNPARRNSHTRHRLIQASAIQDILAGSFVAASAAGLLYSTAPLLNGQAKEKNQNQSNKYRDTDADPGDIKWGVMSVVSFIPLVNWTVYPGC